MSVLWIIIAIALIVGLIKTTVKLLKVVFVVGLLAAAVMFLQSLGLFVL